MKKNWFSIILFIFAIGIYILQQEKIRFRECKDINGKFWEVTE